MPGINLDEFGRLAGAGGSGSGRTAPVILPDVNVLIYAFRANSARHSICKRWLDGIVLGDAQFGLSPLGLSAVARIATNPRIFTRPSSVQEAFAFCDNLLGQPHCEPVRPRAASLVHLHAHLRRSRDQRAARLRRMVRGACD